jgi:hypothetical protein
MVAHGIAETQPFIDGNKRAALVVMLTFLEINGARVEATDRELADWIISFSAGASPREVAMAVRQRLTTAGESVVNVSSIAEGRPGQDHRVGAGDQSSTRSEGGLVRSQGKRRSAGDTPAARIPGACVSRRPA